MALECYEFRCNFTTEGLDPHVGARQLRHGFGWHTRVKRPRPRQHLNAGPAALQGARRHPGQCTAIVHPQPHALAARRQLRGQTPAHTEVAVVIDHLAEEVPKQEGGGRDGLHAADCPTHAPGTNSRYTG